MADPQVIQCAAQCVVTVVHQLSFPPFTLSLEDAQLIGWEIAKVLAIAYGFRVISRVINSRTTSTNESE